MVAIGRYEVQLFFFLKGGRGFLRCYVIFEGGFAILLLLVTRGGGGVKNRQKMRYVICERPHSGFVNGVSMSSDVDLYDEQGFST